jgi:hypothetical protein
VHWALSATPAWSATHRCARPCGAGDCGCHSTPGGRRCAHTSEQDRGQRHRNRRDGQLAPISPIAAGSPSDDHSDWLRFDLIAWRQSASMTGRTRLLAQVMESNRALKIRPPPGDPDDNPDTNAGEVNRLTGLEKELHGRSRHVRTRTGATGQSPSTDQRASSSGRDQGHPARSRASEPALQVTNSADAVTPEPSSEMFRWNGCQQRDRRARSQVIG